MTSDSWWGSRFCKGKQAHTHGICHNRSTRLHFSEVSPCRMLSSLSASLSASNGVVQALRCECLTVWVWVWTRGRFQIRSSFLNTRGGGGGARSSAAFICCPWKLRMSLPTNLCPYLLQRDAVNVWLVFVPYINLLWRQTDLLRGYWIAVFHSFISLVRSF